MARPDVEVMRELTEAQIKALRMLATAHGHATVPPDVGRAIHELISTDFATVSITKEGRAALAQHDAGGRIVEGMSSAGRTALNPPAREGEGDQP